MKIRLLLLSHIFPLLCISQSISGIITDEDNTNLPLVNISISGESGGQVSNELGEYMLTLKPNKSIVAIFSSVGYKTEKIRIPMLKKGQNYKLDILLSRSNIMLKDVVVQDKKSRIKGLTRVKPKHVSILPTSGGGVESLLKTLPGVSSANELSSQYSVRGGNFDENLVYVNGIQIYRPFLIHSGQQEGLSFVNSDLVGSIEFSAGGFSAKYGDKMSSVLDITYKKPISNLSSLEMSLLGGKLHTEGVVNNRLTYLIGARHRTNQYILDAMDTKADYKPKFNDFQIYLNYDINTDWSISFLGNISKNQYEMKPENRETEFGTVNEALKLKIYFEGREIDKYETYFGALSTNYRPNTNLNLHFTTASFQTFEEENFDIIGEYWLYQLDNNLGSNDFGDVAFDRGVGKYIKHARNKLQASVYNFSHNGKLKNEQSQFQWGFRIQKEDIQDRISEWLLIDSAGFTLPHPNDNLDTLSDPNQEILMNEILKTNINLSSYRNSGYMQFTKDINNLTIDAGTRASYWTYNEELLLSPRLSIAYAPLWQKDIVFRCATGIYYQSPFYRELRNSNGQLNHEIKAQKSSHFVFGSDYLFYGWGRPFKWISEIYYKNLKDLIPYKVDNVRIQYLPENKSNGYAAGIDMKLNGEFVPGVESWASLSIMKTEEDIEGDYYLDENGVEIEPGFIPRPTDQRVNFSMFFQDYIPTKPNYKMHLNLIYGTGLPFGPPKSEKYQDILRIPDYRRVDIGFSAGLKSSEKKSKIRWVNAFNSIWISAEVFNLLDINNTVSYLWVSDVGGRQYAVPNYLTVRQLNIKLIMSF